jgi:hypothetical protein
MKTRVLISLVLITFAGVFAQAQVPIQITVDEAGNGLPFQMTSDPSGGVVGANVLVYTLPQPIIGVLSGDIILTEAGSGISDIVRFWQNPQNPLQPGQLIFYSDNLDGVDALADNGGLPGQLLPITRTLPEGVPYAPAGSQDPGFLDSPVTYNFNSDLDSVPEGGATILLLSLSLLGLWGVKRTAHGTK